MSDPVRPQRQQPMKLPHPWNSPGKNTGVGCHFLLQCMKVKSESEVAQSYPTLSDPMDCSLPGSSIHGIFQTRVLEWGVIYSWFKILLLVSHVQISYTYTQAVLCSVVSWLFAAPWTVAHQAPLSMGFSRQEYWNELPFPTPEDLSNPGIEIMILASSALADGFFTTTTTWEVPYIHSFFRFFFYIGHYRVLSRVPCAIHRSLLVIYFIYSSVYTSIQPSNLSLLHYFKLWYSWEGKGGPLIWTRNEDGAKFKINHFTLLANSQEHWMI